MNTGSRQQERVLGFTHTMLQNTSNEVYKTLNLADTEYHKSHNKSKETLKMKFEEV